MYISIDFLKVRTNIEFYSVEGMIEYFKNDEYFNYNYIIDFKTIEINNEEFKKICDFGNNKEYYDVVGIFINKIRDKVQ